MKYKQFEQNERAKRKALFGTISCSKIYEITLQSKS